MRGRQCGIERRRTDPSGRSHKPPLYNKLRRSEFGRHGVTAQSPYERMLHPHEAFSEFDIPCAGFLSS